MHEYRGIADTNISVVNVSVADHLGVRRWKEPFHFIDQGIICPSMLNPDHLLTELCVDLNNVHHFKCID